jgi:hypothetical protein
VALAYLKVLEIVRKMTKAAIKYLVTVPIFEPQTSRIQSRIVNSYIVIFGLTVNARKGC